MSTKKKNDAPLDFDAFLTAQDRHSSGKEIEIRSHTGEPTGAFFTVVGFESPQYRDAERAWGAKLVADRATHEATQADEDDRQAFILSRCVTGWRNVVVAGKPVGHSLEMAERFLSQSRVLRGQVFTAVYDDAGFTAS